MKKLFASIFLAYLIPAVLAILVLSISPNLRHLVFRSVIEAPQFGIYLINRKYVFANDFAGAATWLDRHFSLANSLSTGISTMLPGLISNTEFVVSRVRSKKQHQALLPYLKKFAAAVPEIYVARIWVARALSQTDPASAFQHLDAAVRLIPSDSRAYRIGISAALSLGDRLQA